MDVVSFRWDDCVFQRYDRTWFDPELSWINKWKQGRKENGEAFLFSSTMLVWLTDFWHLCKTLMILALVISIVLYNPIISWYIDIIIYFIAFTWTFEIFYSKILVE